MISELTILEQAQSPEYWTNLNPQLSVAKNLNFQSTDSLNFEPEHLKELLLNLKEEGYFQIDAILPNSDIVRMAEAMEKLKQSGWPVAFAFIYDEFWQIYYRLHHLLSAILGPDYRQVPDVWAWYVDTNKNEKGWEPHRDRRENSLFPDGMPKGVNIWIPLTDVTPLNGCMYILPADLDPNYDLEKDINPVHPQDIRALPAPAGSVLCWNPVVWHWGSRSSNKAKSPRISIACDFQLPDADPYDIPLLDPSLPPNFLQRLGLICKLLLRFHYRYRYSEQIIQLAVKLQKNAPIPYWTVGNYYRVISDRWQSVGIEKGAIVEVAHIYDDRIMARHPQQTGTLYPFPPLELADLQYAPPM